MARDEYDLLVYQAGSVKALDDSGRVGGHLVLFGTEAMPDASSMKDFFTPQTDYGLDLTTKSRVLYHHGLDDALKMARPGGCKLAVGELKMTDAGVWIEAQLGLRDEYEKKLFGAVKDGKMGWSSGTASHLVSRERQANGSHKLLSWPLGLDASITPTPAEPRTAAVSLKSLLDEHDGPRGGLTLDEEAARALTAAKALCDRLEDLGAIRAAEGRRISDKRRDEAKALLGRLDAVLRATEPRATPEESAALHSRFLAAEARLAGIL